LGLFGQKKEVQRPGIRGGKFYYSKKDHKVRYGQQPIEACKIGKEHVSPGQMVLFHAGESAKPEGKPKEPKAKPKQAAVLATGTHGVIVRHEDGKRENITYDRIAAVHPEAAPKGYAERVVRAAYTDMPPSALEDDTFAEARNSITDKAEQEVADAGYV